ncbi:MAG: transketolase [Planctomycetota bacterium]|jgi:transketolase|nr:transketolase [Planctomycetota bacterium]
MDKATAEKLRQKAKRIRTGIIEALGLGKPGHLGGSMSAADMVAVLYYYKMNVDPKNPKKPDRDRFIMSKGHSVLGQYAALADLGYYPWEELSRTKTLGGLLQGHPEISTPGIEANTGSLGQGLSLGVGMCLAARRDGAAWRVFVVTGDAELGEGQIWEAATAAANYKLDNLRVLVDANGISAMGRVADRYNVGDADGIAAKFAAFGWNAKVVDGHDVEEIGDALDAADRVKGKPSAIVGRTVKGKGVSFAENTHAYHNKDMSEETRAKALAEING